MPHMMSDCQLTLSIHININQLQEAYRILTPEELKGHIRTNGLQHRRIWQENTFEFAVLHKTCNAQYVRFTNLMLNKADFLARKTFTVFVNM